MTQYRKKPIVIEAVQWPFQYGSEHPVMERYRVKEGRDTCVVCEHALSIHGWIHTLEGGHIVCPGDWIITGVQGERYPCKPDIFDATYDLVEEPTP